MHVPVLAISLALPNKTRSKLILWVIQGLMQSFKMVTLLLLGLFVDFNDFLTTEVSAGAVAKADQ